jgi:hypothetical protein
MNCYFEIVILKTASIGCKIFFEIRTFFFLYFYLHTFTFSPYAKTYSFLAMPIDVDRPYGGTAKKYYLKD